MSQSPARRALEAAKRRFPRAYWRVRTAASLAAWAGSRLRPSADAYDDAFWDSHAEGDWEGFARVLLHHLTPASLADVGCGSGQLLRAVHTASPGTRLLGLDGSPAAVARARAAGLEAEPIDLTHAPAEVRSRLAGFDVALCLEVAEHLPPWSAGALVRLLSACGTVVFSAAQPLQGGVLHVNEQPPAYWARRFARLGFAAHPAAEAIRGEVAALALAPWYAANLQVFRRAPSA